MKVTKFIIGLLLVSIIVCAIESTYPADLTEFPWWQPIVSLIWLISPALLVMAVEPAGLKSLWREYLSLKGIKWRSGLATLAMVAVLAPVFYILTALAGEGTGIDCLGRLMTTGHYDNGLFTIDLSTAGGRAGAVGFSMVAAFVAGIPMLINHIFGEIGFRGYLQKYMPLNDVLKPLAIGIVWALFLFLRHPYAGATDTSIVTIIALTALKCIAYSYLLTEVLRRSGSVWFTAATLGIIESATWFGIVAISGWNTVVVTIALWLVLRLGSNIRRV